LCWHLKWLIAGECRHLKRLFVSVYNGEEKSVATARLLPSDFDQAANSELARVGANIRDA